MEGAAADRAPRTDAAELHLGLVFDKQEDGSCTITSQSADWGGCTTWCTSGEGVYLEGPGHCSRGLDRFHFVPHGGGTYTIGQKYGSGPDDYNHVTIPSDGKRG